MFATGVLVVAVLLTSMAESRGEDADDASALAARLSEGVTVRRKAVYGLWQQGKATAPVLISIAKVLADEDEYVRTVADRILARFANQAPLRAAIPVLVEHLSDARPSVRRLAITNLWRAGPVGDPPPEGYESALVVAARNADPLLRANAVATLGETGRLARRNATLLREASLDTDADVRLWATVSLGYNCVDLYPDDLVRLAGDEDKRIRIAAIRAFASNRRTEPQAAAAVLRGLRDDDVLVRNAAIEAVIAQEGAVAMPMAIPLLFATLDRETGERQRRVVVALGALGDPRALGPLSGLLAAGDPDLLPVVVESMARLGPETRYVAKLLSPLLSHHEPGVVGAAARALVTAADLDGKVAGKLLEAASHGDARKREAVVLALGSSTLRDGGMASVLEAALRSPDRGLRIAAARTASSLRIRSPGLVAALGFALGHEGTDGAVEPFLAAIATLERGADALIPVVMAATSQGSVHRTLADVAVLNIATSVEARASSMADLVRVLRSTQQEPIRALAWRTISHARGIPPRETAALDGMYLQDHSAVPEASMALVALRPDAPAAALDVVIESARAGDEDAIRVLGRVRSRDAKAADILIGLFRTTRPPSSRAAIIDTLSSHRRTSVRFRAIWLEGLGDPSSVVRHAAFRALRRAGWIH